MTKLFDNLHLELFESLEIGLAINDMEGNLLYVNKGYANLIGFEQSEVLKLSYWDITPKKYADQEEIQLKSLAENKSYGPYDKEYIHKNGSLVPVRLNGKVIQINGLKYIWSSVEDIAFSKTKEVLINLQQRAELIDKSVNEIFIFDYSSLKFHYANQTAQKNIGYTTEELSEMTPLDIKPKINKKQFEELLIPLIKQDVDSLEIYTVHQRKDGSYYDTEIKVQMCNYEGHSCYIAYINDITEKNIIGKKQEAALEELNKSLQFQRIMQKNAAYALISTTTEGIITSFNKAAEELLEYKEEEIINKESPALFHDLNEVVERSKEYSLILNRKIIPGFSTFTCLSDAGLKNENEWTYITKSGKNILVLLSVTNLINSQNKTTGYLGIASNITERKEKERELQNAKRDAENALEIKSEFLANMSHEIRTPMNGIMGMTSILLNEVKNKSAVEKLEIIQTSTSSLLEIIDDILDVSKVASGQFKIAPINFHIKDLFINCINIHKASVDDQEINLIYKHDEDIPELIFADQLRIKQILNNLLSNAIKFTPQGDIKLSLTYEKSGDNKDYLHCSVKDSGIGMSPKEQEHIFLSFRQADNSTTRRYGGTGLGLTITKSIIERMGGNIWVQSEKGKGSIFSFKIPIQISTNEVLKEKPVSFLTYKELPISILVVEDNVINQKVISGLLNKLDYRPTIASNGKEALDILDKKNFDLVLMDCHMPVLDGFKATKEIIMRHKNTRPFIVAVSASAMTEDVDRCYESGMDYFISKPISLSSIGDALNKFKISTNK